LAYGFGSRSHRVYEALRDRIRTGELVPGTRLPSHREMAATFGVAPMTIRQVLARLEQEGVISREHGRGTFVRAQTMPGVLVVADEIPVRTLLCAHITDAGYHALEADGPAEARAALESDHAIALILTAVRMPTRETGTTFISLARRRWPHVPLAAMMDYPDDLAALHGTAECPVLILTKPIRAPHVQEILRLALPPHLLRPTRAQDSS
jgi:DNA-binding transcriptional regulator YhcF (GntR family)